MFLDTKIKVDGSRSVLCFLPSPFFLFFFNLLAQGRKVKQILYQLFLLLFYFIFKIILFFNYS